MEPGFQAIVYCMIEAQVATRRGDAPLCLLIAANDTTHKENAMIAAELAIARAIIRAREVCLRAAVRFCLR